MELILTIPIRYLRPDFVLIACKRYGRSPSHREIFTGWILPFQLLDTGGFTGLPILVQKASTHARFLDSARVLQQLAITLSQILPSPSGNKVGTRIVVISELNSPPTFSPVNKTSPKPLCYHNRRMTQDRRPLCSAKTST